MSHGLVGREPELHELSRVLAQAGSGRVAAAVIRGDAGSGKSALLNAVSDLARAGGWTCLTVRGIESESFLAGAGLLAALTPLRADLDAVPAAQAEALVAALGWGAATTQGDRFLVGAGTLSLLAAAALRQPILVAVDDVQWLDLESAEALSFAARRLGHDRVAVVVTHRLGVPAPVSLGGFEVVPIGGLSPGAARSLLGPQFSPGVVERLVSETGGNALALRECRRTLSKAQRAGAAPLPQALPVPDRLMEVYARELEGLTDGAWRAAVLCAASGDEAASPVFASLTAEGLDAESCLAEAGDLLVADDGVLTFRHPLLRSATWKRAAVAERRSAHRALARVVPDAASRVWHRAEATSGYDDGLADDLAAVADIDRSRRGFSAAAAAMERAARLTTDPDRRADRLAAATDDAYVAGDVVRVRRLAPEVLDSATGAEPRARVLYVMGQLEQHYGAIARSRELFEQASHLARGRLLLRPLTELAHVCHFVDDAGGVTAAASRAATVADRSDPEQAMLAAYLAGAAHVVEGRPDLGAPLLHRAIDLLETDPVLRDDSRHLIVALFCVRWLMDVTVAADYAERRIDRARALGALGVLAKGLSMYCGGLIWMGDHVRAYAVAGEAIELVDALGYVADPGIALEIAASECAPRGLHEEARRLIDRARSNVAIHGFDPMPPHLAQIVSQCAFARGDLAEVVDVLEDQVARFGGVGWWLEPLGVAPLLVEAYLGLGRDDDARRLTERFAAAQSDRPYPQVAAMVARCRALVATDLGDAVAAFERALALHAGHGEPVELARTQLLYGMRLRRSGRRIDARVQLEAARKAFRAMDQTLWAERAEHELAGTGERAHARDATRQPLTSQETRVALLAAEGLTNREVAAALFLSPKTVEHHMGAVLRKRGLRSRTQLARTLVAETRTDSDARDPHLA